VTVLIGENGSGKSTLIEVCQLLQRLAAPDAMATIQSIHGGIARMLRPGHLALRFGVTIEGAGPRLEYDVAFSDAACIEERLVERGEREVVLLERSGTAVSRDDILDRAWSEDEFPTSRTVDNFIMRLRRLIEIDPVNPRTIRSIRGVGYLLEANHD
jgi:energy-coupling factor transporter ATP-binding protein EcfA2